ncbi:hypothetical protein ACMA1D_18975 [Streptomyces sp. 796.1]|uniref:hypothetical protein n=1 Tax=Streptomyces sp. 796.1 TaxID=3163029 RepID=UPI0039C9653F
MPKAVSAAGAGCAAAGASPVSGLATAPVVPPVSRASGSATATSARGACRRAPWAIDGSDGSADRVGSGSAPGADPVEVLRMERMK